MGEGDCTARRLLDGVEDQPRTIEADRLRPGPHAQDGPGQTVPDTVPVQSEQASG